MVAATAVTFGATINPRTAGGDPPAVQPTTTLVTLSAQSTPLAVPVDAPALLTDWIRRVVVPPSLGAPVPAPQFPPMVAPTSIGTSIKGLYNAVEPWVRYGFDLAAYAVGWIPYVGWLAPQITIFYNFGERIARSITFNIADWLDGRVTFVQGLTNVGVDTFYSFVQLGIDQWNFWLPSLPPLPPLPFSFSAPPASSTVEPLTTPVDVAAVATTSDGNATPSPGENPEPAAMTLPLPFSFSAPPASSTVEPLTTPVDVAAVAATSAGNSTPRLKNNGEVSRRGTTTGEPLNVDLRDSASANESKKTTGPSETATTKLPQAERADSANRKPTAGGTERDSLKTDSVKPRADR